MLPNISTGMSRRLLALILLLAGLGCGGSKQPTAVIVPLLPVDDSPAWSLDGRWIAYHRGVESSLGPPGLYLLDQQTGVSQLLITGDSVWPREIRFSRDGTQLLCNNAGQVIRIDGTGKFAAVPVGTNLASEPDWGPGNAIFYRRVAGVDAGLWCFDLVSHSDTALTSAGARVVGSSPRWSEPSQELAFSDGGIIKAMKFPQATLTTVAAPPSSHFYEHPRWIGMTDSLLMTDRSSSLSSLILDLGTSASLRLTYLGESEAFNARGDSLVMIDTDAEDAKQQRQVLFVRPLSAASGAGGRQVTFYVGP